jgi:hypothetical protein
MPPAATAFDVTPECFSSRVGDVDRLFLAALAAA